MLQVRAAFDPLGLCNPGKIVPVLRGCGEARAVVENSLPEGNGDSLRADASRLRGGAASLGVKEKLSERQSPSALQGANGGEQFDPEKALRDLIGIVGESNASWHLSAGETPNRQIVSVAPSSISEISELMRLASKEHWSVLPSGAETWLDLENSVNPINLIVSTRRLDRLIEHEPADLVATAEAGIPLSRFNGALSKNGQWLPLDPPDDGRATIGGVVATGTSGAQKYGYGPPRRYVIGMKVVLADGRVVRAGGRVVKNVAGYDLCKLFTGSQGTLGVIAELTFKLRPVPAEAATIVSRGTVSSLVSGARAVIINRLFPVAVELLSQETAEQLGLTNSHKGEVLMTRFAGAREAVSYQTERALELLRTEGATNSRVSEENDPALWDTLAAFPLRFGGNLVWRASMRPAELPFFLEKITRESIWHASVAAGSLHVIERESEDLMACISKLRLLRNELKVSGGCLVIEKDSIKNGERIDRWDEIAGGDLMHRIKQQLDPEGILPRLVGTSSI
jgi:FAD/FMN-containing dehydrogenase